MTLRQNKQVIYMKTKNNNDKVLTINRLTRQSMKPLYAKQYRRRRASTIALLKCRIPSNELTLKNRIVTKKVFAEMLETHFNELSIRLFGKPL